MKKSWQLGLLLCLSVPAAIGRSQDVPRPTPLTRPSLKQWIEDVKQRTPRIPLPVLSDQDRETLGDQADSYESRLRFHYLKGMEPIRISTFPTIRTNAADTTASGGRIASGTRSREQDPKFSLDNAFKVELFWIVSRINNCQYCLGHQESKLLGAGKTEDQIAALDGDWSEFGTRERTAFAFARKFTLEPYAFNNEDIETLRKHFDELQILEMIMSMSGNNSINRWKEGVGVPQRADEGGYSRMATLTNDSKDASLPRGTYLTPTSNKYSSSITKIMPLRENVQGPTCPTLAKSRTLESFESVKKKLFECQSRSSRLPLVETSVARQALNAASRVEGPVPNWMRLLAHFPTAGNSRAEVYSMADQGGDLTALTKAQLSWIVARNDGAWYALGQSMNRLVAMGQRELEIAKLDSEWSDFSIRDQSLFRLAKKLATSPVTLTDNEVADAVKHAGPRDTVQAISYITSRASFDRLTEAAGIPLEQIVVAR